MIYYLKSECNKKNGHLEVANDLIFLIYFSFFLARKSWWFSKKKNLIWFISTWLIARFLIKVLGHENLRLLESLRLGARIKDLVSRNVSPKIELSVENK